MGKCSLIASDALMNSMVHSVQFYVLVDLTCLFVLSVHVVFGHVISGQEVVQTMESQKTDPNSRPYAEVKVLNCGELVPKSKGLSAKHFLYFLGLLVRASSNRYFNFSANKGDKKKVQASSSSSSSSSESGSSSDSSSDSEESEKESKKKKKKAKKLKKRKKKKKEKKRYLNSIYTLSCL